MKKIILGLLTFSVIIIAGCKTSSNGDDPIAVLNKFFDALSNQNVDEAKKYVTKESEGMMSLVQMGMQGMSGKGNEILNYKKNNIVVGSAVIDGDKATVPIKDKKSGEMTDFTLRKESGEWKVAFDKSTLMEMAQKKMKEHGMDSMMKGMNDSIRNMPGIDSLRHLQQEREITDSTNK